MTSLSELYYNPKSGFLSEDKLYRKAKENGIKVTHKIIKEFLDNQYTQQITTQDKRPKIFSTIYENNIRDNYQMDIIVYNRYEYHNYKYIFVVIDIYSRYAQARAMTNRKNDTIMKNLKNIIEVMGLPKKISCDNEFATKEFEKYCNKNDIDVIFSEPNDIQKNSIVERLNRTIALLLQKYRVSTNKYDWYKVLPDIIYNYNNSYHRTIKNTPENIFYGGEKNNQTVYVVIPKLKIGDKVRLKIFKSLFSKGDEITYSKEVYIIDKIENGKYLLNNGKLYNGNKIKKVSDIIEYIPKNENEVIKNKEGIYY